MRWEEFLKASTRPLCFTPFYFPPRVIPKWRIKCLVSGTISVWKIDGTLQRKTVIAAEVLHNLCWHMRQIGGGSDSICQPLMGQTLCQFHWGRLSNCIQNASFKVPSQHWKWHAILLLGDMTITYGVFQHLPMVHKSDGRSFLKHLQAPICVTIQDFHQWWHSNCPEKARFGWPSQHV